MNLLKEYRLKRNKTQFEIATKLGISQSTYNGYETGYRTPNVVVLYKIANILKIPKAKLLEEFGKEQEDEN